MGAHACWGQRQLCVFQLCKYWRRQRLRGAVLRSGVWLHRAVPSGDGVASKIATRLTTGEHTRNLEVATILAPDQYPHYPQITTGITTVEHTANPEVAPSFTTDEHTEDPWSLAKTTAGGSTSSNGSSFA